MSSPIQKVAFAGATGSLGQPILHQLLSAGFTITALSRTANPTNLPSSVKIAQVDYNDPSSLQSALTGQDALISTLGSAGIKSQIALTDAAISAGVRRIIPSEFGCDNDLPRNRTLPAYKPKIEVQDYIIQKTKGTRTSYTFVYNNAFLDWGLKPPGFLMNVAGKSADLYDGGDIVFTATPLEMIGRGVVGVLRNPEETANRSVRVHGAGVTMKQILALAQKYTGGEEDWTVKEVDCGAMEEKAYGVLKTEPGNVMAWIVPMIRRAAFGKDVGNDFTHNNDNAVLGVKELRKKELEEIVKAACS
ncbi:hypothetical protein BAUCODRAFT_122237 [Baudoinia panamericana UAMH 10762]|uniref:NmrA-like domain-containing protein n=1 Tax=Baudoinia panamericana (strain UAMH 10762) TaxID=717646 RepID=M2LP97_BAUPA|nr:uncharacterized protein BAUCODRAFT_122237 [Baudoinia panamericana UAMH 10762]EMC96207.1 hypothetical protein BAUCODRAFT_122237 [Baudoinia panamericana UAMH 10762]